MHESDFWDAYRSSQTRVTVSNDVKRTIVDNARFAAENESAHQASTEPANKPTPRVRRGGKILVPIAACLAVLALLVGVVSFTGQPGGSNLPADFAVQAYAADTNTMLEMGTDNRIIFERGATFRGVGDAEGYATEGVYTGCLFNVEGEGITQIQASISTGVIYRYEYQEFTSTEGADRLVELASWKPSARGTGEHYGAYDFVESTGYDDGLAKDDPNKLWRIALSKKLGQTIDVPVAEGQSGATFGLWTNEAFDIPEDSLEASDAVIDLFDGETLTVTATFADGHTTTQTIELHAADVKGSIGTNEQGDRVVNLTPEIVDPAGLEKYTDYVHTLYGTVVDTNHEPFPGSLENANELENVVSEAPGFDARPLVEPITYEKDGTRVNLTLDDVTIRDAGETAPITYEQGASLGLSNLSVLAHGAILPEGLTRDDLRGGMQNWEYFNRVVSQVDGFTVDDAGTLSDGFSWVMLEADIANLGDTSGEITADGGFYGTFAIADDNGTVSYARARSFAITNGTGFDASIPGAHSDLALAPGETTTVRWLCVLPDYVVNDPSLLFMGSGDSNSGFAITLP